MLCKHILQTASCYFKYAFFKVVKNKFYQVTLFQLIMRWHYWILMQQEREEKDCKMRHLQHLNKLWSNWSYIKTSLFKNLILDVIARGIQLSYISHTLTPELNIPIWDGYSLWTKQAMEWKECTQSSEGRRTTTWPARSDKSNLGD